MSIHELLSTGTISLVGRHPDASNAVFLVDVEGVRGDTTRALYKPVAGERPLWDFPRGELARREVLAWKVARALRFDFVPCTVWRDDAPAGPGSLQQWIEDTRLEDVAVVTECAPGWVHVLDAALTDGSPVQLVHRDLPELQALALFDALLNNGDRKAGHILRDPSGNLHAVDHGVTFHAEPRLRTVLWGFEGRAIPRELLERLHSVDLPSAAGILDDEECSALAARRSDLLERGVFPGPSEAWPSIPWPIY